VSIDVAAAPREHGVTTWQLRPDTDDGRLFYASVAGPKCGRRDPHDERVPLLVRRNGRGGRRLTDTGEGRNYDRYVSGRVRHRRTVEGQMVADRSEHSRGHSEDAAEFVESFERLPRRAIIEPCRLIIGRRTLRRDVRCGPDPFANCH